ncbi:hypothetical protein [Schinkia azotoformans]|uniref:hypothetical protein n=1 Tax=Schinkia azotoformans TaxID=1454 RepID=UPI002DB8FE9C|nr:hypothetical protein [Schinkia azotoformans]MEC1780087.1 hypothetical protein [Schinkia azotoformans]MED4330834.1 hypothetical protein [Schinkia azotoformans]
MVTTGYLLIGGIAGTGIILHLWESHAERNDYEEIFEKVETTIKILIQAGITGFILHMVQSLSFFL